MGLTSMQTLLSPAELSYLHTSLSLDPPIRPDGRSSTQFRPLTAEVDILPSTNGSARICFADGTEAIVGVKAEVERTNLTTRPIQEIHESRDADMKGSEVGRGKPGRAGRGDRSWVGMSIDMPGFRDDDALPIFLASLLNEALHTRHELVDKLYINERFHWKLHIDVLLISPPLSYPVPLLSLTIHLALLATALPALISSGEEDPMFNDDWEAADLLYPPGATELPPITLLAVGVGGNVIFDPSKEELAVADAVLAISLAKSGESEHATAELDLISLRTVDPLSRVTAPGLTDAQSAGGEEVMATKAPTSSRQDRVWAPPTGGMKRGLVRRALSMCLGSEGVANEVLTGLQTFRGGG